MASEGNNADNLVPKVEEGPPFLGADGSTVSVFGAVRRYSMRILALCGSVTALWVVIGTLWFPQWWYAAIIEGYLSQGSFFRSALLYLVSDQMWLLIGSVGLVGAASVFLVLLPDFRKRVERVVDRWSPIALILSVVFLVVDVIVLLRMPTAPEGLYLWAWGAEPPAGELQPTVQHEVKPPVDFLFLDTARIIAMFSQVEPDLVEKQRTVSSERKLGASAGVDVSGASLKGETSNGTKLTSEYGRSETSSERKCLRLINYMLAENLIGYFTTANDLYRQYGLDLLSASSSKSDTKGVDARFELIDTLIKDRITGFVVVDGSFHQQRSQGAIQFQEEFSNLPRSIVFRFSLPPSVDVTLFPDGRPMRVFAEVIHPLDSKGVIELHPLAVF